MTSLLTCVILSRIMKVVVCIFAQFISELKI